MSGSSASRGPITTHILDTALGTPARGVTVHLYRYADDGSRRELAHGVTDDDGRITDLLAPGPLEPGTYCLRFATRAYFAATQRSGFYPWVEVAFTVKHGDEHYHVPLLLNPFGYSTYRGS